MSKTDDTPLGVEILLSLAGHGDNSVTALQWIGTPDQPQQRLASASTDGKIIIWGTEESWTSQDCALCNQIDLATPATVDALSYRDGLLAAGYWGGLGRIWRDGDWDEPMTVLEGHGGTVWGIAFLQDSSRIATASSDKTLRIWDTRTGECKFELSGKHESAVNAIHYIKRSNLILSGSGDHTLCLWSAEDGGFQKQFREHKSPVYAVTCTPDEKYAISGDADGTIIVWDLLTRTRVETLSKHSKAVRALSVSADGRILASKSNDGTLRLWDIQNGWHQISVIHEQCEAQIPVGLAFSPTGYTLASAGENQNVATIWKVFADYLLQAKPSVPHRVAKVVLLGDSGVGKTALSRALAKRAFMATESTHGRAVRRMWVNFDNGGPKETREIVLWDLAGQPGYRVLHPIFMSGAAAALVLVDPRSVQDSTVGPLYWEALIRRQQQLSENTILTALIRTRSELLGSRCDFDRTQNEYSFHYDKLFPYVSAKNGIGVDDIFEWLSDKIDWSKTTEVALTPVSTMYQLMRQAISEGAFDCRPIWCGEDILKQLATESLPLDANCDLTSLYKTLKELALQDYLIVLPDQHILFQPELLDKFLADLINQAKNMKGVLSLAQLRNSKDDCFPSCRDCVKPTDWNRIKKILINAAVEILCLHDIAFFPRPDTEWDTLYVPSEGGANPGELHFPQRDITFAFDGAGLLTYAQVVARLVKERLADCVKLSDMKVELEWKRDGTSFLLELREPDDQSGEISIHSSRKAVSAAIILCVKNQVERAAISKVEEFKPVRCSNFKGELAQDLHRALRRMGIKRVGCPMCEQEILNLDDNKGAMLKEYDALFFCNRLDEMKVGTIKRKVEERLPELKIFFYRVDVHGGELWNRKIRSLIEKTSRVVLFLGEAGIPEGSEFDREIDETLEIRHSGKDVEIFPVLLVDRKVDPRLRRFSETRCFNSEDHCYGEDSGCDELVEILKGTHTCRVE